MDAQLLQTNKRLLRRAANVRQRYKMLATESFVADIKQILLRFIQKPNVIIMYISVLVLFAAHIDSNTHDILDDLAAQFPNNTFIEWAKSNFFRICGALVFIPVIIDTEEKHRNYLALVIFVFLMGFPQRSIMEYFIYSISFHVYAKAKHPVTRIFIIGAAVFSCVMFGIFTNEQLRKLYAELPKVPTHPVAVNRVEKVANRASRVSTEGTVNFG
nr:p24 protein [Citrus leprosis virus C]